jgi:hypothetical protein
VLSLTQSHESVDPVHERQGLAPLGVGHVHGRLDHHQEPDAVLVGRGGLNMGLGNESFLGLYNLPNPGGMHHMCIGVDDYNPDALAEKLQDHGIDANVNRDAANRTSGGDQL